MSEPLLCVICGKRRPKRYCPALSADICSLCCGVEREVSVNCPLDCPYLKEAHRREQPEPVDPAHVSYPDVEVSEATVREKEELLLFCVYTLVQAALRTAGAVDSDVMAALDAAIRTHRTLDSGLLYETRPSNAIAAELQRRLNASLEDYAKEREEKDPLHPVRNSEVLAMLVFLHRVGQANNNGRPRGRLFIDLLRQMTPDGGVAPEPGLIL